MNTLIEIAGSTLIGSLLIVALLTSFYTVSDAQFSLGRSQVIQSKTSVLTDIISSDIHKTGMNIPDSLDAIVEADSLRFTFLTKTFDAISADTVSYYHEERPGQDGELVTVLLRSSAADTDNMLSVDFCRMRLAYFDSTGNETLIKENIRSIEVSLLVEDFLVYKNYRSRDFRQWKIYLSNIVN